MKVESLAPQVRLLYYLIYSFSFSFHYYESNEILSLITSPRITLNRITDFLEIKRPNTYTVP